MSDERYNDLTGPDMPGKAFIMFKDDVYWAQHMDEIKKFRDEYPEEISLGKLSIAFYDLEVFTMFKLRWL